MTIRTRAPEEQTGHTSILDTAREIEYRLEPYIIKVRLTPSNEFLGIVEISTAKDFRAHSQRFRSAGHDLADLYEL